MSLNMPEDYVECDDNVVEFLDGGDDTTKTVAGVLAGIGGALVIAGSIITPIMIKKYQCRFDTVKNFQEPQWGRLKLTDD